MEQDFPVVRFSEIAKATSGGIPKFPKQKFPKKNFSFDSSSGISGIFGRMERIAVLSSFTEDIRIQSFAFLFLDQLSSQFT